MIEETIKILSDVGGAISGFGKVEASAAGLSSRLQGIGGTLTGIGAKATLATAPLSAGLAFATKKAIDFDTAMSGASRALDLSEKEVKDFTAQIKDVAPALGLTPTKFAELATEAGKLGVAKDNIIGFGKVVAEIAAITDLTDEQTKKLSGSFAALQTITGVNTDQLNVFGAAVNKLDDSIGGTTPEIIEFTRQTAASGKLLKLGIKDLAAYGSTLQSLGIQNGVAYRSFNALLTKLAAPQTLSKKGQEALQDLGLSAEQMAQIMTTNANQGIRLFLERINEVSKVDVSKALGAVKQIVGGDYGDEVLTLAASSDKLGQALAAVGDNMDKANLAKKSDELAKKLGNVKGQQAIITAQMERLAITIGSAVLPSVTDLLGMLTPLVEKFARFAEANPAVLKAILAIAAVAVSIGPVLAIVGGITSAIGAVSGIASVAAPIITGIGVAFAGLTAPMWVAIAAFAAAGAAIALLVAKRDAVFQFFGSLGGMAKDAARVVGGAMYRIGILTGEDFQAETAIGVVGSAIRRNLAAAGKMLSDFLGSVANFGGKIIAVIGDGVAAGTSFVKDQIQALTTFLAPAFNTVTKVAAIAGMAIAIPFIFLGTQILKGVNAALAAVIPPLTTFVGWLQSLWNGFTSWFNATWTTFSGYVSQAFITVSNVAAGLWQGMTSALASVWNAFSSWFGGVWAGFSGGVVQGFTAVANVAAGLWRGMTTALANTWVSFTNWLMGAIAPVVNIGQTIANGVYSALSGLWTWVQNFVGQFFQAGVALVTNFANGIRATFSQAIADFNAQLAQLRGLLPGSEPKIASPLSNLADAGAATLQNFASGFEQSGAMSAMSGALSQARSQLTAPQPTSSASGGSGTVVVNDNRTININGAGNGNDIIEMLRKSDRELLDLIQKAQARWYRAT